MCACISLAMEIINIKKKQEVLNDFIETYDMKFFKTLGEPVRIKILEYLMLNGRSDIQSIADNMPQDRSVISRHLNQMQEVGILRCSKETRHKFYEIDGDLFIEKLESFLNLIKESVAICCPDCCS